MYLNNSYNTYTYSNIDGFKSTILLVFILKQLLVILWFTYVVNLMIRSRINNKDESTSLTRINVKLKYTLNDF